jgi:hypothetical protein
MQLTRLFGPGDLIAIPNYAIMEFSFPVITSTLTSGNTKIGYTLACGGKPQLRVLGQVTHQHDFIQRGHSLLLLDWTGCYYKVLEL